MASRLPHLYNISTIVIFITCTLSKHACSVYHGTPIPSSLSEDVVGFGMQSVVPTHPSASYVDYVPIRPGQEYATVDTGHAYEPSTEYKKFIYHFDVDIIFKQLINIKQNLQSVTYSSHRMFFIYREVERLTRKIQWFITNSRPRRDAGGASESHSSTGTKTKMYPIPVVHSREGSSVANVIFSKTHQWDDTHVITDNEVEDLYLYLDHLNKNQRIIVNRLNSEIYACNNMTRSFFELIRTVEHNSKNFALLLAHYKNFTMDINIRVSMSEMLDVINAEVAELAMYVDLIWNAIVSGKRFSLQLIPPDVLGYVIHEMNVHTSYISTYLQLVRVNIVNVDKKVIVLLSTPKTYNLYGFRRIFPVVNNNHILKIDDHWLLNDRYTGQCKIVNDILLCTKLREHCLYQSGCPRKSVTTYNILTRFDDYWYLCLNDTETIVLDNNATIKVKHGLLRVHDALHITINNEQLASIVIPAEKYPVTLIQSDKKFQRALDTIVRKYEHSITELKHYLQSHGKNSAKTPNVKNDTEDDSVSDFLERYNNSYRANFDDDFSTDTDPVPWNVTPDLDDILVFASSDANTTDGSGEIWGNDTVYSIIPNIKVMIHKSSISITVLSIVICVVFVLFCASVYYVKYLHRVKATERRGVAV